MPIPYIPYDTNSTIAEMILRAGQQNAEATRQQWGTLANTVGALGQIPEQIAQRKRLEAQTALETARAGREETLANVQMQQFQRQAADQTALDNALGQIKPDFSNADEIAQALPGHMRLTFKKSIDDIQQSSLKMSQARDDYLGHLAVGVKSAGATPMALQFALQHAKENGIQGADQIAAQIQQDPTQAGPLLDSLIARSPSAQQEWQARSKPMVLGNTAFDPITHQPLFQAQPSPLDVAKFNEEKRSHLAQEGLKMAELTGVAPGGGALGPAAPSVTAPGMATGDDFLKTLPPDRAAQVKAYAEGRMPIPAGFALKSPYFQAMMREVSQYDPTFDAGNYPARAKARADFTSGVSAKSINALNTVIGHLGDLHEKMQALGSTSVPAVNAVKNWLKTASGSSDVTNFETVKKGVTDELTRVWRQAGGTEADIKSWAKNLDSAGSPEQLKGQLATIGGMLESKLEAFEAQKQQALGEGGKSINIITPQARQVLDSLEGSAGGGTAGTPPPGATIFKYNADGTRQ